MGFGSRGGFPTSVEVPTAGPALPESVDNPTVTSKVGPALSEALSNPTVTYEVT